MITVAITGQEQVWANLDQLNAAVRDKLLKRAMKAALTPIVEIAADLCDKGTGILADSIGMKISSAGTQGNLIVGIAGPRTGIRIPVSIHKGGLGLPPFIAIPTRYAHLVEFGHDIVTHDGRIVGHVGPHAFMRPAWDEAGGEVALYTFSDVMQDGIATEVAAMSTT